MLLLLNNNSNFELLLNNNSIFERTFHHYQVVDACREVLVNHVFDVPVHVERDLPLITVGLRDADAGKLLQIDIEVGPRELPSKPLEPLLVDGLLGGECKDCLLYTSPSPRDRTRSRMPSSA